MRHLLSGPTCVHMLLALTPLVSLAAADRAGSGWKQDWIAHGVRVDAVYTIEGVRKFEGGAGPDETVLLDNFDLTAEVDTRKAGWWPHGRLFGYVLSNQGREPTELVGDIQATSNIEAADSVRLYELWYEQGFGSDRVTLLAGLHDLNAEFYTSDHAGLFFNSSFGIGPDIAGNVPVSIFNVTTVGVRLRAVINDQWTALAAVYDGDPGSVAEDE